MAISDIKRTSPSELIKKHGRASSAPANIAMLQEVVEEANTDIASTASTASTALSTAIGDDVTPIVRTNNPTLADNDVNTNIGALDAAIGVTPTSSEIINNTASVNANISTLDAAVDLLNKRDLHTESDTNIIKHKLLALGTYDFSVDGSGTSIEVTAVDVLPLGAIITNVYLDITTDFDSTVGTTNVAFEIEQGGGTAIVTAFTADGSNAGVIEESTIPFPLKVTEASKLILTATDAEITAGVATLYVEYLGGSW